MTATKIETDTLREEVLEWTPPHSPMDMPQQVLERPRRAVRLPWLLRRRLIDKPV
jgi:hypothetical protein